VLLDFAERKLFGESISSSEVRGELERVGHDLTAGDIVLIRTGAAKEFLDNPAYPGLSMPLEREALFYLLDQGVRTIGCDAESVDGPAEAMVEELRAGCPEAFFPVHYAGREREFVLVQKMDLAGLTQATGFKVAAFPIKLEGAGAAWTRAVGLVGA
jgi:kynurenine formamidase